MIKAQLMQDARNKRIKDSEKLQRPLNITLRQKVT